MLALANEKPTALPRIGPSKAADHHRTAQDALVNVKQPSITNRPGRCFRCGCLKGRCLRVQTCTLRRLISIAVASAVIAACGTVTTTPHSGNATATFTTTTSASVTLPKLASAGVTITGMLPAATAAVAVSETISTQPFAGVAPLAQASSVSSARRAQSLPVMTPIVYVAFSAATSVTVNAGGVFTIALPNIALDAVYELAAYGAGGWIEPVSDPGTVDGTTITLTGLPTFTVTAGAPAIFAVYAATATSSPSPSATPTIAPTATPPTATPSPAASPSPAPGAVLLSVPNLAFTATGAASAQTFAASQANGSGTFTASTAATGSGSCTGIATIAPTTGSSFTVTPLAAGACTFTIAGDGGQSAALTIDVTSTTLGGS
jgi:hypothetical protein